MDSVESLLTFQRNLLPPPLGSKNKTRQNIRMKLCLQPASWSFFFVCLILQCSKWIWYILLKHRLTSNGLHSVITPKV
jgi:hypothetical protein